MEPAADFGTFCADVGLPLDHEPVQTNGTSRRNRSGSTFYFYDEDEGRGTVGCFATDERHHWFRNRDHHRALDPAWKADREQRQREREQQQKEQQHRASIEALNLWTDASRVVYEPYAHPYVQRKGIRPYSCKYGKGPLFGTIILPLVDTEGNLWSYQTIDHKGAKRLLKGGRKQGCFCPLGNLTETGTVFLAEGWATACTIRQHTGHPVVMTVDAGNIEAVYLALRTKYPHLRFILAADNDHTKSSNKGLTVAHHLHQTHGLPFYAPPVSALGPNGSDFNDMASNGYALGLPTINF